MSAKHLGLFSVCLLALGCTQTLDFDSVSGGASSSALCTGDNPARQFCDDFDGQSVGSIWGGIEEQYGAVSNDSRASVSGTVSMLASSDGVDAGTIVRAVVKRAFPEHADSVVGIRASFDMRVDQFDPRAGAQIGAFALLFGPLDNFNQLVLNVNSTGDDISVQLAENAVSVADPSSTEDNGYAVHGPFSEPAPDTWTNIRVEVDVFKPDGGGNQLRIFLDGEQKFNGPLVLDLKGAEPRLELGLTWVDTVGTAADPWSVRYDNFVVEMTDL